METSIGEMEFGLKPVTAMWDTVKVSAENINLSLKQLETVTGTVRNINQTIETLEQKRTVLTKDPTSYFDSMLKALELQHQIHKAQR